MNPMRAIFIFIILALNEIKSDACKGCVELDELSYEKIVKAFPAALVKFDIAFPYGDKHEIFEKFSKDVSKSSDILVAQVGIKDYGDRENEKLAKKYNINKEEFPTLLLFKNGDIENPIRYPSSQSFTLDNIKRFFKMNSEVYLGAAGCIEEFDKLVFRFMKETTNRQALKEDAENLLKKQKDDDIISAKTYTLIMNKVLKNGESFVQAEQDRVKKLLSGKLSTNKQEELSRRLNILDSFSKLILKDEL